MLINTKKILVVGGAGYIGSHMVLALQAAGYDVIVLDNLSTGHRASISNVKLVVGDMGDKTLLRELFLTHQFDCVMHFASFIEVGESVRNPLKYYQNNVSATLNLLEVLLEQPTRNFIFSSTAAVYGEPQYVPMDEQHPIAPINPYGRSKRMVEEMILDLASAHDLRYAILRYFNAAGADPKARTGECHEPESHLIPIVLQAARGVRKEVHIYGNNYQTRDGTCVRDYVHVSDLCLAHLLAMEKLFQGEQAIICNLGTGKGTSVQEVINVASEVTGKTIPVVYGSRRAGDPEVLVASSDLANKRLGWSPIYPSLHDIVRHAWQFQLHHSELKENREYAVI